MKATIENGELVIRLPLNPTPNLSSSGKSQVKATTHGNQKTDALVEGRPVIVGVNAYIPRPTRRGPTTAYEIGRQPPIDGPWPAPLSGGRALFFPDLLAEECPMTTPMEQPRPARALDLFFFAHPGRWDTWPFLPVVRRHPSGEVDYGVLYDALHATGRAGFSSTVFLCNLFLMPTTEAEFLALPREVFDTFDEMAAAGWRVD